MILRIKGRVIDIRNQIIAYTKQLNLLSNLNDRQTNFSNSINAKKTPNNRLIFDMLGVTGNQSIVPYDVAEAVLDDGGVQITKDATVTIRETGTDYKLNIKDGIIKFFDAIANKNLSDLDFTDINHDYCVDEIINSQTNTDGYIYAFAQTIENQGLQYLADYPAPSVFIKTLVEKVCELAGFTAIGDLLTDGQYLNSVLPIQKGLTVVNGFTSNQVGQVSYSKSLTVITAVPVTQFEDIGLNFVAATTGFYKFNLDYELNSNDSNHSIDIRKNGVSERVISLRPGEVNEDHILYLQAADNISVRYIWSSSFNSGPYFDIISSLEIDVIASSETENKDTPINFGDLYDMTLREFIKSVAITYNVLIDVEGDNVRFDLMNNILSVSNAVDLSDKFISQESETYILEYAQRNKLTYQYDEEQERDADGYIFYDNKNVTDKATKVTSPYKASELNDSGLFSHHLYKEDGTLERKGIFVLSDSPTLVVKYKDFITGPEITGKKLDFTGLRWATQKDRYRRIEQGLLVRSKRVNLRFNLNAIEFRDLDLKKLIFIKYLGSYFYIEKAKRKTFTDVQAIRVLPENAAPIADAGVDIVIRIGALETTGNFSLDGTASSDPDGSIVSYQWTVLSGSATIDTPGDSTSTGSKGVGVAVIQLEVTDTDGLKSTDTLNVTVTKNEAPVAVVNGPIQVVSPGGGNVTLDGSSSYDNDGTIVSHAWSVVSGGATLTQNAGSIVTNFLPIGEHVIRLTVTDNEGATDTEDHMVNVVGALPNPHVINETENIGVGYKEVQAILNADVGVQLKVWAEGSGNFSRIDLILPTTALADLLPPNTTNEPSSINFTPTTGATTIRMRVYNTSNTFAKGDIFFKDETGGITTSFGASGAQFGN